VTGRVGRWVRVTVRLMLVAALLALLLGLGNRPAPKARHRPLLDVVVAVDRTTSMSALDDPSGSRMTAVRGDLLALGGHLDAVRFSLVTFGTSGTLEVPFTSDRSAYDSAVRALQVEPATAGSGSSIDRVVPLLVDQLDQSAAAVGDHIPVLVLVSDGENTEPSDLAGFTELGERLRSGVVLGYGTSKGGSMPLRRVAVDKVPPAVLPAADLVTDQTTGRPAVSRLDRGNLHRVATDLGVTYVHSNGKQDLAEVANAFQAAAYADLPPTEPQRELRWWWALVLLVLALVELRLGWRRYLETRRERGR